MLYPQALLSQLKEFTGLVVDNNQIVKTDISSRNKKWDFRFERDGALDIKAPEAILQVIATDASGNQTTIEVSP
jgi:hypothetical protein